MTRVEGWQRAADFYPGLTPAEIAAVSACLHEVHPNRAGTTRAPWPVLWQLADAINPPACTHDATMFLLNEALNLIHGNAQEDSR